ncbi:MAG: TonB-dependent receptor [Sulfuricellaceae bacterium]|nr:TonB-dependent receptor [Sulfuricellaceae bacterium]
MAKKPLLASAIAVALGAPLSVHADSPSEIQQIRAEIQALKQVYEARIASLEKRLEKADMEAPAAPATQAAVATQVAPEPARANAFNPDISLILQGRYSHSDKEGAQITGFLPLGRNDDGAKGFSLDGSELILSSNIGPGFRGLATLAITDDEVAVEEAWFQTLGLGQGFTLKGGRFLSGIGYANEQHPHAWDFADQNLPYAAMIGESYGQDGLQVKWLAPTPFMLELGAEIGQGVNRSSQNKPGSWAAFAHIGDDLGDSHSWRAGISRLDYKSEDREGLFGDVNNLNMETLFNGRSKFWIADFVWKWAPNGNAKNQNFKFQAEYLHRDEDGSLDCADNTANGGACTGQSSNWQSSQSGWYAQGIYQFHPNWRTGYRYDRLDAGTQTSEMPLAASDYQPQRHSLMFDYNPSEFSRFRLQLAQDKAERDMADHQITLQYIHSLGAHGAHSF